MPVQEYCLIGKAFQVPKAFRDTLRNIYLSAHAEALVALAVQRNPQDLDYLLQVAKDDTKLGQHGIVRGGALKGKAEAILSSIYQRS